MSEIRYDKKKLKKNSKKVEKIEYCKNKFRNFLFVKVEIFKKNLGFYRKN